MVATVISRKNKISLIDYDFEKDIKLRLMLPKLSEFEHIIIEEIFYCSLKINIKKLANNLEVTEESLIPTLEKLSRTGLLQIIDSQILIDKKMRKYFEFQMQRLEDNFQPDLEFFHNLLKLVSIDQLPSWYNIPRTSNNIFGSIIEKYFITPQIFERHLHEIYHEDPHFADLLETLSYAPNFQISINDYLKENDLEREELEKHLIYLEYCFVCCVVYKKTENGYEEFITPYKEWQKFLFFLKKTHPQTLPDSKILKKREDDFAFINDMSAILSITKKKPMQMHLFDGKIFLPQNILEKIASTLQIEKMASQHEEYIYSLIDKLCQIKLAEVLNGHLYALDNANDWLKKNEEEKSIYLYQHPYNELDSPSLPSFLLSERSIQEAEKCILRALHSSWIYLDECINGAYVALNQEQIVRLKKQGKNWQYHIPKYSSDEKLLMKEVVLKRLFEVGFIKVGYYENKPCFRITNFGKKIFEKES